MPASFPLPSADPQSQQEGILPGVSRTFALTIPQLPQTLRPGITNAYLLCRTADTIEDSARLSPADKAEHYDALLRMLDGEIPAAHFAANLLAAAAIPATTERDLLGTMPEILAVYRGLPESQRRELRRCMGIMCEGMRRFEHLKHPGGLPDRACLRQYCYVVAGVVGEFLTNLFCQLDDDIDARKAELLHLAPGFGQGLQMTNILKDIWDDRQRGICWLPRDVFRDRGCDLSPDAAWHQDPAFRAGLLDLVAVAHFHLHQALHYTQLIPRRHRGIRRFCSWAVGMALYTLRNIRRNPGFSDSREVKISRRRLRAIIAACNLSVGSDRLQRFGFAWAARGLPEASGPQLAGLSAEPGP